MRCFIAVGVPDDLKKAAAKASSGLKKIVIGKFVGDKNQHLTLKFLGEITTLGWRRLKRR